MPCADLPDPVVAEIRLPPLKRISPLFRAGLLSFKRRWPPRHKGSHIYAVECVNQFEAFQYPIWFQSMLLKSGNRF